ncbi:hypothetical protein KCV87_09070 [Actinosynnema pretiosum subsp. pretiosum]|uniref:PE domain-containing protein n=2 Tax=Actinosynnema TaxID=40566 RepID=C6WI89_ACTMD|nr:hypothetical protein [Actinosynnema mirum]ACU36132.1 hypothetical protein Amir_2187 [Actinosynnema mirum DSM 43827]QUF06183.1 hypothetical protein KCV87_09070 [Actinosynnema pretiosum subsp. pretiosum]
MADDGAGGTGEGKISFWADTAGGAGGASSAGGHQGGQTEFTVSLEGAKALRASLEKVVETFYESYSDVNAVKSKKSFGVDPHSASLGEANERSLSGQGVGYLWANKKASEVVVRTIAKLDEAIKQYEEVDDEASSALKNSGTGL